jgi:hypothetical protein
MTYWMVACHVAVMAYALLAVCDEVGGRRSPAPDRISALRAATGTACVLLLTALVADTLDGGRKLAWVRGLWEASMIACIFAAGLAIRILKGDGRR